MRYFILYAALFTPSCLAVNILVSLHNGAGGLKARGDDTSHRSFEEHLAWVFTLQDVGSDSAEGGKTGQIVHKFTIGNFVGYSGDFPESVVSEISAAPEVATVTEDSQVTTNAAIVNCKSEVIYPALSPNNWGIGRISHFHNAPTVSQTPPLGHRTFRSLPEGQCPKVTAYILDSGISLSHPHFGGRARWGTTINPAWDDDDVCGHGTHVAGIVASVQKGTKLVAVKVLEGFGGACTGSWSGVIAGLQWAFKDSSTPYSVIHLSLSGNLNPVANAAVQAIVAGGVSVVVSAGNHGGDSCMRSPASEKTAITVGATTIDDRIWPSSGKGCCVDIWAPGEGINSTLPGGEWVVRSGTSMAAPFVTGVILYNKCRFGHDTPAKDREGVTDWKWVARSRLSGLRCTGEVPVSAEQCKAGVGGGCADNKLLFNRGCDNIDYPGLTPL